MENPSSRLAYQPVILRNLTEICATMGVGKEKVFRWIDQGAPIAVEKDGPRPAYTAELAALQNWRLHKSRDNNFCK